MIGHFLRLHLRQFYRILEELGIMRLLFLVPFFFYVTAKLIFLPIVSTPPDQVVLFPIFLLVSIHTHRGDWDFLKNLDLSRYKLMVTQYGLIALPFALVLGYTLAWVGIMALMGTVFLLPLIRFPKVSLPDYKIIVQKWVPADAFEWKNGLRKWFPLVIIMYTLAIVFAKETIAIPAFFAAFGLLTISFYLDFEPQIMVEAFQLNARKFITRKLYIGAKMFLGITFPLTIIFLVLHLQYWFVWLFCAIMFSAVLGFAICLKYALYRPDESMEKTMLIQGFAWISCFIPFFLPIPIVLFSRYFFRSIRNMKDYV